MESVMRKLKISRSVVGRDSEIEQLRAILRSVQAEESHHPPLRSTTSSSTDANNGPLILDDHSSDDVDTSNYSKRSHSIYISGVSGIGKTALVTSAFRNKDVGPGTNTYFCRGKFDLLRTHRPFSALVDAINMFCTKVYFQNKESLYEVHEDLTRAIVEDDLRLLQFLFPNLRLLTCTNMFGLSLEEDDIATISSSSSTRKNSLMKQGFQRLKTTLYDMIKTLLKDDEVLILFIDDLQWADADTMHIVESLVEQLYPKKFIFVGGFRNNEVDSSNHPLTDPLNRHPEFTKIIELQPLSFADIVTFVADTLKRDEDEHQLIALVELIYEQTQGNVFYCKEYLGYLHRNGHIYYSLQNLRWEWEAVSAIEESSTSEVDLEAVVQSKIKAMPPETVHALKVASCLGSRFDLDVLDFVIEHWQDAGATTMTKEQHAMTEHVPIEGVLWHAVDDGLLEEMASDPLARNISYKFTHDKVQTASFALIGQAKESFLVQTGQLLLRLYETDDGGHPWMLILGTDLQCKGISLLKSQEERDALAQQCFDAASELRNTSAFESAASLTRTAIELLGEKCWTRNYALSLSLFDLNAAMEFCVGNQVECDQCVKAILTNTKSMAERYNAYYVYMENLGALRKHDEAMRLGIQLLRRLKKSRIPRRVTPVHMLAEVLRTTAVVRRISTEKLINYDVCEDESMILYTKALLSIVVAAYFSNDKEVLVFLSLRSMRLSLRYGYTRVTAFGICACGMVCGALGSFKEAMRLGEVALKVAKRFACPEVDTMTYFLYYLMLHHLNHKVIGMGAKMMKFYKIGLNSANVAGACLTAGGALSVFLNDGSMRLNKFIAATEKHIEEAKLYRKEPILPVLYGLLQWSLNLAGRNPSYTRFEGEGIKDLDELLRQCDAATVRYLNFQMVNVAAYFWEWEERVTEAKLCIKYAAETKPGYFILFDQFFRCSIFIHLYEKHGKKSMKRLALQEYKRIRRNADLGLENQKAFTTMLEAELAARLYDKPPDVVRGLYDAGIRAAENDGYVNYTAVMRERAGAYFLQKHQPELAKEYLELSLKGFAEWGANGKVRHMRSMFKEVLLEE